MFTRLKEVTMNEIVIPDFFVQKHLKRRRSSYGVSRFRAKNLAKQQEFTAINDSPPIASSSMVNQLSQPTPLSELNIESSRSERRDNETADNGNPQRHKQCQCKQTKCLKLYCECFSSGLYCNGCKCLDCHNNTKRELARNTAVRTILKRKPNAFRRDSPLVENQNRGCHCKKTQCLKRYCECFQANILCSENCNCLDCKNYDGHHENLVHEIIGFDEDNKTVQQVNTATTLDSPPVLSIGPPLKYRSLLADIISPHSIRNFCSRLVIESDPSKMLAEKQKVKEEDIEIGELVLDDNLNERQKQTRSPKNNHKPNIYSDQERIVLTSFRDYLQKFISCGISKAEAVAKGRSEQVGNGTLEEKVEHPHPHLKCTSFR